MASGTPSKPDVMIIVDDKNMTFNEPSLWRVSGTPRWYGGTSMWSSGTFLANETFASFSLSFQGISIAFFGNSPAPDNSPTFSINIDSQTSSATYPELRADTQWYTSPILTDEPHEITLSNLDQIDVDYAIITPGDQTPLEGTTLTVDDSDPEIVYYGQWKEENGRRFDQGIEISVRPLRSTTHTSTSSGDSFVFQFAGTSISVHGLLPLKVVGSLDVTFTLDGSSSVSSVFPDPNSKVDMLLQPNYLFYKSPTLTPGNHSLIVNVTGVVGEQSFIIDHLTYIPSFARLSQKPNFASTSAESGSTATATTSLSEPTGQTGSKKPRQHVGAIVGGVVGGVITLLAILLLLLLARRRHKAKEKGRAFASEPFSSMSAVDVATIQTRINPSMDIQARVPNAKSPSPPLSIASSSVAREPMRQTEVQRRLDQISLLTSQIEEAQTNRHSNVDVEMLYTKIDQLTKENERLMRGYMPPPAYEAGERTVHHRANEQ
ncbi:hypothetical protein Moror_1962 [Moniliophthora roreri MCA 2997]|uniref:Transmembrane protein n=2 Tax=Moniliophthora roreri TaxID=221103 RepID=V2Y7F1_MONRO|nr:hypothetical protein Moror_1962 [Moniliophthora roreri MCA 2997]